MNEIHNELYLRDALQICGFILTSRMAVNGGRQRGGVYNARLMSGGSSKDRRKLRRLAARADAVLPNADGLSRRAGKEGIAKKSGSRQTLHDEVSPFFSRFFGALLHWKFAQIGIPIVGFGIGALMLTLDHYLAGELCVGISSIWGVLSLWMTNLENFHTTAERLTVRIIGTLVICVLGVWVIAATREKQIEIGKRPDERQIADTVTHPAPVVASPVEKTIVSTAPLSFKKPSLSKFDIEGLSHEASYISGQLYICIASNKSWDGLAQWCNTVHGSTVFEVRNKLREANVKIESLDSAIEKIKRGASIQELREIADLMDAISQRLAAQAKR